MPRPRRTGLVALAITAIVGGALSTGCSNASPPPRLAAVPSLLAEARSQGLPDEDPLDLEPGIKASVADHVRAGASPREKLRLLEDYLGTRVRFEYASNRTLTAQGAWRERRGDCMAFTNLFVALARHVGLNAYFVHVREVRDYYERGGRFFVSSHVAVGLGSGPEARVIDLSRELSLWREMSDWKLAAYQAISDVEAVALYYSNVAVDRMLAGDAEDAERLFRFWLGRAPSVAELHNNLAVLLNRRGRHDEALSLLTRAIDAFPTFKPLYTNAMAAARGAGRPALAQELARRGEELEHDDPFFLVARALTHYQQRAYGEAARELERARSAKPDSPVILAWLTRAYLRAGERERGAEAFDAVRRLAPEARLVRDLEAQFPELRLRDAPVRVD